MRAIFRIKSRNFNPFRRSLAMRICVLFGGFEKMLYLCIVNTEILEQLNESQRVAVEYCDGASLVIAGAGSGKTRVLTYKTAWLLERGKEPGNEPIRPWNILALTFTNKAAREGKNRPTGGRRAGKIPPNGYVS